MSAEIEFVLRGIYTTLKDLHTVYTHDQMVIDREYYDEIALALYKAEKTIKEAGEAYEKRKTNRKKWYE